MAKIVILDILQPDPEFPSSFEAFVSIVESFEILQLTRRSAELYGEIVRPLRAQGRLIDSNDLWIAAVALENELPLVTSNTSHFGRVPGLRTLAY